MWFNWINRFLSKTIYWKFNWKNIKYSKTCPEKTDNSKYWLKRRTRNCVRKVEGLQNKKKKKQTILLTKLSPKVENRFQTLIPNSVNRIRLAGKEFFVFLYVSFSLVYNHTFVFVQPRLIAVWFSNVNRKKKVI